ncbi:MAG: sensor histidine kinase [Clostridiaceae bacterium]
MKLKYKELKGSIRVRFAILFIGIIVFSCIVTFLLMSHFSNDLVEKQVDLKLSGMTASVQKLYKDNGLAVEEIKDVLDTVLYEVNFLTETEAEELRLSSREKKLLSDGEVIFINYIDTGHKYASMTKLDDYYLIVTESDENTEAMALKFYAFITFSTSMIIGSLLMFFAVRMITEPIQRLTRATKEVAKGNFSVRVKYLGSDEIGVLINNFNLMAEELNNIEYLRKDFINNVSHEFKTPIASIQGFARLLKSNKLTDDQFNDYTDIIIEESERLTNLSSNILKLSQVENQAIAYKRESFSLDEQIRKTILLFEEQWSEKELELDIELQKVDYLGDEDLIKQIWINLLSNAIKFSKPRGRIGVSLESDEGWIRVIIEDNGIGIADENKTRIFEKFYQADTSHGSEGSGLGLSIVKNVIELNKGHIYLESSLNKGTRFFVELPKE